MTTPTSESRQAFNDLLDLLRELSERYAGPEWLVQEADDVAEALRAILHLLEASLLTRVESSPEHPWLREWPLPTRKFLGDNSDAIYYETAISPDHTYELRGNPATAQRAVRLDVPDAARAARRCRSAGATSSPGNLRGRTDGWRSRADDGWR